MIIPGGNLLGMALQLIAPQTVEFFKDIGRTTTPDGEYVTQFATPVTTPGCSVQAVDRTKYADAGLEMAKSYFIWYTQSDVQGVGRGKSGDVIEWGGMRMQVASDTPWYGLDGWDGTLVVVIGAATGSLLGDPAP